MRFPEKASAQGWAAPAGIGVQLAEPDRDIVAINGDGEFMFTSPAAMYTAAYYYVPLTVIVLNNRGWGGGTYDSILENEWGDSDSSVRSMTLPWTSRC